MKFEQSFGEAGGATSAAFFRFAARFGPRQTGAEARAPFTAPCAALG